MARILVVEDEAPNVEILCRLLKKYDFEVVTSAEATRVTFAMSDTTCTFPASWDGYLRWWVLSDDGGGPGESLYSGFAPDITATKVFDNCPHSQHYSVTVKLGRTVPLASGVRYWLALHMAADWSTPDDLFWGTTSPGHYSPGMASRWGSEPWSTVGLEHAFRLEAVSDDDYLFVDGFEAGSTIVWSVTVPS